MLRVFTYPESASVIAHHLSFSEVLSATDTKANLPRCPLANDQMQNHDPTTMRRAHPESPNSPAALKDLPACLFCFPRFLTRQQTGDTHTFPTALYGRVFLGVRWFTTSWGEMSGWWKDHWFSLWVRRVSFCLNEFIPRSLLSKWGTFVNSLGLPGCTGFMPVISYLIYILSDL